MAEEIRERVLWRGMICTVTDRKRKSLTLRDPYGFVEENVPKRETEHLNEDDERKAFKVRTEG